MTERHLVPISSFLTTTDSAERPLLSSKQESDVIATARMYLRDNRIGITSDVFQRALGVMGDAARRGLALEGKAFFTTKERIRALIADGLEIREDLRRRAENLLKLSTSGQTTDGDLIGPLALPIYLIRAASNEVGSFALVADPKASQELVRNGEQRLTTINHVAQTGLDHLPPELSGVTLDRFPTVWEKAGIVRNMIASFVFRGSLSPIITTGDLKDFANLVQQQPDFFNEQAKQQLIASIGSQSSEAKQFLSDLFDQTATSFARKVSVPKEDKPKAIDDFYRYFTRNLLLLHPALEEQQMTTLPNRVVESQSSIWDNALVIGNFKIPKPEALVIAARQAGAKGDQINQKRINNGMTLWRRHESEKSKHQKLLNTLEAQLKIRQQLLANLADPYFPLPDEAYFVRYVVQAAARRGVQFDESEAKRQAQMTENILTEINEARRYQEWLKDVYEDHLPQEVPMPKGVLRQRLLQDKDRLVRQRTSLEGHLRIREDLLDLDFFWILNPEYKRRVFPGIEATYRTKKMLDEIQKKPEKVQRQQVKYITEQPSLSNIERQFLSQLKQGQVLTTYLSPELTDYQLFWVSMGLRLQDLQGQDTKDFWLDLLPAALKQRAVLLQNALVVLNTRTQTTQSLSIVNERLQNPNYTENWSVQETRSYIGEMNASLLPTIQGITVQELAKTITSMRNALYKFPVNILPEVIPDPETFLETINSNLEGREQKLIELATRVPANKQESGQIVHERVTNRKHQTLFKSLAEYLDHPLFPMKEGVGLARDTFIKAWERRVRLADILLRRDVLQERTTQARQIYETIMRFTFKETLEREIRSKERNLTNVLERNIDKELVDRMAELNLVLEEE